MTNPFCHLELRAGDAARAKDFYAALFDWGLQDLAFGDMTYTAIDAKGGPTAGLMQNPAPGSPSQWLAFVEVADVAAATKRAGKLGATVVQPKTEIPGRGWFTVIADPTGAALGLVQHG